MEEFYMDVEKDLVYLVNPKTGGEGFIVNHERSYRNLEKIIAKRLKTRKTSPIFVDESSTIMYGAMEDIPEELY